MLISKNSQFRNPKLQLKATSFSQSEIRTSETEIRALTFEKLKRTFSELYEPLYMVKLLFDSYWN